jgi:hypothetical protein
LSLKDVARKVLPDRVVAAIAKRRAFRPYRGLEPGEIFSKVYAGENWGDSGGGFYSGTGSHEAELIGPFIEAVTGFLGSMAHPPAVVDLGCGDFHIGAQLLPFTSSYIACDVVPELIAHNRTEFADLPVEFRVVNIAADPLPAGDVVIIRQVLQHLSNDLISRVVAKLPQFDYAVISEHVPTGSFVPNLDIPTGPYIRTGLPSGVDVTQPPFNLAPLESTEISRVPEADAEIVTTVYRLK